MHQDQPMVVQCTYYACHALFITPSTELSLQPGETSRSSANYAYIVSEARNHGLQVFDLTRLRGRTQVVYDQPDAVNNDFGNAHNIAENSDTNFVYVVGATSTTGYPKVCKGQYYLISSLKQSMHVKNRKKCDAMRKILSAFMKLTRIQ